MNERIKELWKQSQTRQEVETFTEGVFHTRVTDNYEKFAELIINECRDIVIPNFHECRSVSRLDKMIRDHFGVK